MPRKLTKKKLEMLAAIELTPGLKNANHVAKAANMYNTLVYRGVQELKALGFLEYNQGWFLTSLGESMLSTHRQSQTNPLKDYLWHSEHNTALTCGTMD